MIGWFRNLLSLEHENLCEYLLEYLDSQISWVKSMDKITLNEFIEKPYNFLIENDYLDSLPLSVCKGLKSLINSTSF